MPVKRFSLLLFFLFSITMPATETPNLILISVDTLRADHLGCYGYYRNTSPHIDSLAAHGILFTRCLTESPLSVPAMATVMTSLPAFKHGAKRNGLSVYEGLSTLADLLSRGKYRTAGFISNWPLKDRLSGLGKGFDHYQEIFTRKRWLGMINPEGMAPDVNQAVEHWLNRNGNHSGPFFLWIHYIEPHAPYINHPGISLAPFDRKKHGAGAKRKLIDPYDSEIVYVDRHIGLLIDLFKGKKVLDNSVLIFTADHGESFGEHDYYQHGRRLYDDCLHVPLIIRLPGSAQAGTRNRGLCSLTDIAPTLLYAAGIPKGKWMEGQNLLGGDVHKEFVFSEAYKGAALLKRGERFKRKVQPIRFAITTPEFKLIFNQHENNFEAYHTRSDPFEEQEQFTSLRNDLRTFRTLLITHIRDLKSYIKLGEKKFKQPAKMTLEDLEKLKSLGYID